MNQYHEKIAFTGWSRAVYDGNTAAYNKKKSMSCDNLVWMAFHTVNTHKVRTHISRSADHTHLGRLYHEKYKSTETDLIPNWLSKSDTSL